jgi:predicted DNA-binding transcriptional regulator
MNIFNLLLYFGIFFIVMGFALFLYSEMKIREIDRQMAINDQKIRELLNAK